MDRLLQRLYKENLYRKFNDLTQAERRQFSTEDYYRSIAYKQKHDIFPMKERRITVEKEIDLPEKFEDKNTDWVCTMCFSFDVLTINVILTRHEIRFGEVYEGITTRFSTTCNSMDIIREGKIPFRKNKFADTPLSKVFPDNPKFEFVTVYNTPESPEEIFYLDVSDLVDAFEETILSNDYILGSDPSAFVKIP